MAATPCSMKQKNHIEFNAKYIEITIDSAEFNTNYIEINAIYIKTELGYIEIVLKQQNYLSRSRQGAKFFNTDYL